MHDICLNLPVCEQTKQWELYNNCRLIGALKAFCFPAEEHLKQAFQDKRPSVSTAPSPVPLDHISITRYPRAWAN